MEEAKDAAGDVVGNVFEGMGGVGDAIGGALGSAGAALKEEFSPSAEPGAENEDLRGRAHRRVPEPRRGP